MKSTEDATCCRWINIYLQLFWKVGDLLFGFYYLYTLRTFLTFHVSSIFASPALFYVITYILKIIFFSICVFMYFYSRLDYFGSVSVYRVCELWFLELTSMVFIMSTSAVQPLQVRLPKSFRALRKKKHLQHSNH